jgi:HK97 family phage major capsid protein
MSDRLKELREKRARIVTDMRAITEAAEKEKRELSAEESVKHDTLFKEQDKLRGTIQAEERQAEVEREAADRKAKDDDDKRKDKDKPDQAEWSGRRRLLNKDEYRAMFTRYLKYGNQGLLPDDQKLFQEARALASDSDPAGGYLVAPEQFVANLIKFVDDMVFIRSRATKYRIETAKSLGAPSLDNDPADADWTSELGTGGEDSSMSFGKRELTPYPLAKRIKVSKKLMRASVMNAESLVTARLGYKFGITQEKAFLTGDGANKPLGVFTASSDGIPTGRDVSTGSATDFTMDGIISAKYTLKAQYWAKAEWLFHRDGVSKIAKLKDTTNQYLWQPSTQAGQPDRLHGLPMLVSEYVPNTFTTGLYVGMLADFSWYWIVDALDMQIQRLIELYAETNQDGFIGRMESDGMPVLAEAFVRLKTA